MRGRRLVGRSPPTAGFYALEAEALNPLIDTPLTA